MAGAGYKLFNTGDVLTAAQVNTYLQEQTVMVFASSTARTTALSGVLAEGMMSYLTDTNAVEVYNGSTWVGVSSGMTNPMTTTGDIIYSSSGSTPARLGIGTAGQILKVNSGATAPEWGAATAAGKNFTLLNAGGTALSGTDSRTVSGITGVDQLLVVIQGAQMTNTVSRFGFRLNGVTTSTYVNSRMEHGWQSTYNAGNYQGNTYTGVYIEAGKNSGSAGSECFASLTIFGISTAGKKPYIVLGGARPNGSEGHSTVAGSNIFDGSAITSVTAFSTGGNWTAGTIYVYGA